MKKALLIPAFLFVFSLADAQDKQAPVAKVQPPSDFHSHRGFHFEFGVGPAFGIIRDEMSALGISNTIEFSGTGAGIELKLGGALQDDLVLTFDILSKSVSGPQVSGNGTSYTTSSNLSLGEVTYGGGLTYYFLPSDIFLSGTVGTGAFVVTDTENGVSTTTRSHFGFSGQVKGGKHFWISSKWGISIGAAYGFTSATSSSNLNNLITLNEKLNSGRFTITATIGLR